MNILGISETDFFGFFLILLRLTGLFVFAPIFGSPLVPQRVKAAAVLGLSLCFSALGLAGEVLVPATVSQLALVAARELIIGLLAGFVARLVFVAVEFGGQVVGLQMGLGIVSVMDPQFETQVSVVSQLQLMLASLLFLSVGGDRILVEAFAGNLGRLPLGQPIFTGPLLKALTALVGEVFRLGLQLSAPVVVALFATQVVLGVFARSVPQMNMLILGFPLQILAGFGILGLSLSHWGGAMGRAFSQMFQALGGLLQLLR